MGYVICKASPLRNSNEALRVSEQKGRGITNAAVNDLPQGYGPWIGKNRHVST